MLRAVARVPLLGLWLIFGSVIFVSAFLKSWVPLALLFGTILIIIIIAAVASSVTKGANYNIVIVNKEITDEDAIKLADREEEHGKTMN